MGPDTPVLAQVGFHEIRHPGGAWTAGCSVVAPAESQLRIETPAEAVKPVASGQSPGWWLLVLAIAVVTGESMLYHRRKVG
jgi:hypothetical protein